MPTWIDIPAFVDGQVVQAKTWQDFLTNLNGLQQGEHHDQQMPGPPNAEWTTTSGTFVAIDTDYYRQTIRSYGGDLLIVANLELFNTDSVSKAHAQLRIDGTAVGNTDGLHYKGIGQIYEVIPLVYIATGIEAGEHEIIVEFNDGGTGTAATGKDETLFFWITELH